MSLKALLLQMKLGKTLDERVLAEEEIINLFEDQKKAVQGLVEASEPFAKAMNWISTESLEANSLGGWSPTFCGKDFVAIRKAVAAWEAVK